MKKQVEFLRKFQKTHKALNLCSFYFLKKDQATYGQIYWFLVNDNKINELTDLLLLQDLICRKAIIPQIKSRTILKLHCSS